MRGRHADSALEVTVRPSVTTAPANVRIVARAEPHEDTRVLVIEPDSAQFFRARHVQLGGPYVPRMHPMLLE